MAAMARWFGIVVLVALALVAGSSLPVSAHAPADPAVQTPVVDVSSTASWHAAPTPPALPWAGIVVSALLALAVARRPRRAVALAIVLVLLLFAFETGVHSVHHLNDRQAGAACTVASGTAHVAGTPVDGGASEPLVLVPIARLALDARPDLDARSLAVHQGRAPPLAA
jgi:hypothetical protein